MWRVDSFEKSLILGKIKAGGEGEDRGWDSWMVSLTQFTWVWVNSGCWWWTRKPGILQSMESQRIRYDWVTKLNALLVCVQFSSVTQSCPTLRAHESDSMPGLLVHHQLPEFTQTHIHQVGDAIQPSHPLSSHSPPIPNPSQHQGLFQWVNSSHEVAKVLEFQLQRQSFQWMVQLTSVHDYLKNCNFEYMDLCQESGISGF